ncbi:AB hydrolase-1 domain-containing protein [Mycena sanguinolenta]|uniref:AB hydrolase-1 domain-containing protein n=1 Tax=Mycena sanguinolenta TaxID=230812 RepID=A0A8H6Y6E3_9AGAR|nr:AB hydrolase-1 domain-containing protein [Mycena sanguinolenta]
MAMATVQAPLPPSREIPSTFSQSMRSWWATNHKGGAVAEMRLFHHRLPFLQPEIIGRPNDSPVIASSSFVELDKPKRFLNTLAIKATETAPDAPPPAFVDSLETWRKKMQLEQITLIGHSLGGYLSTVYALKYPERVHKLILLSPAGVPRNPDETSAPEREIDPPPQSSSSSVELASHKKVEEIRSEQAAARPPASRTRRLFRYLWEEGWSPFAVIRNTYFWAPMLIGKVHPLYTRFIPLAGSLGSRTKETRDIHDYIMHITLAKGSGEYCVSHIFSPGAHARMPLVDRVAALKIPVTFVYGDHDWMDPEGGEKSVENLRKAGNGQARSYIVNNAGHHVYLDNPKAVNDLMIKELNRRPSA